MSEAATHLRELAERIGPRPATTDTEAEAAEYIEARFRARGLDVERQEFLAPRTYAWAYVAYHFLTILAAVVSGWLPWVGFVLATAVAVTMWLDLDTRWGLSSLMPKGPSQNVIGRKPAKVGRGEIPRKVIIVAHYDSARASLAFHPRLVKDFEKTFGLMKWCTWLVPVLTLILAMDWRSLEGLGRFPWYLTMAVSAYLVVPLLINVHRELVMGYVDGANDNASGVAAMLRVLEIAIPEEVVVAKRPVERVDTEAEVADEEATATEEEPAPGYLEHLSRRQRRDADDIELKFAPPGDEGRDDESFAEDEAGDSFASAGDWDEGGPAEGQESFAFTGQEDSEGASRELPPDVVEAEEGPAYTEERSKRRGLFGRRPERSDDVADWLGLEDFDPRDEGKRIGSWDQFEEEIDDTGDKRGAADAESLDDPEFPSSEAARIRHLVTSGTDRALAEREVWFVATGSEETGTWGMRAFLDEYGDEVKRASIINIDNVGSGTLTWVTKEGMARRYDSDRRIAAAAKRAAQDLGLRARGREYKGLSTDATPALARGFRAMSVMAFDINGRLQNWHWKSDTVENVSDKLVDDAADFVAEIAREL